MTFHPRLGGGEGICIQKANGHVMSITLHNDNSLLLLDSLKSNATNNLTCILFRYMYNLFCSMYSSFIICSCVFSFTHEYNQPLMSPPPFRSINNIHIIFMCSNKTPTKKYHASPGGWPPMFSLYKYLTNWSHRTVSAFRRAWGVLRPSCKNVAQRTCSAQYTATSGGLKRRQVISVRKGGGLACSLA